MKTVVIWDNDIERIKFFVTEEDMTGMHQAYINGDLTTDEQAGRLNAVVYDKNGDYCVQMLDNFPVEAVQAGAQVIVCGFLN